MRTSVCLALCLMTRPAIAAPAPEPLVARAKAVISKRMVDPESLRISDAKLVNATIKGQPRRLICGEFNSKNRFGGYVGNKGFVYDPDVAKGVMTFEVDFYSEDGRGDFRRDPQADIAAGATPSTLVSRSKVVFALAQELIPECIVE